LLDGFVVAANCAIAVTTVSPGRSGTLLPDSPPEEEGFHAGKESGAAEGEDEPLPESEDESEDDPDDPPEAPPPRFDDPTPSAPASLFKSFDL